MMEGKMHGKKLEEAKMHYEEMMAALDEIGMDFSQLKEQMDDQEEDQSEGESEDMGEASKPSMDKGKIALIVAKMKSKMKGSEE